MTKRAITSAARLLFDECGSSPATFDSLKQNDSDWAEHYKRLAAREAEK